MEKSIYKSLSEWRLFESKAYNYARLNNLLPKICKKFNWILPKIKKPNGYWNYKSCIIEAKKYNSVTEWQKSSNGSYNATCKNNWLKECTKHMIEGRKPNNYWNFERCKEEALKYNVKSLWIKNSTGAYDAALKNKWIKFCCKHMLEIKKPNGYWTKINCINDAKKYKTKTEWRNDSLSGYSSAKSKGYLKFCCKHMNSVIKSFDVYLNTLKEFINIFNQIPAQKTKYKNINIGRWINNQKTAYKKGKLLKEQIKQLESIKEWQW